MHAAHNTFASELLKGLRVDVHDLGRFVTIEKAFRHPPEEVGGFFPSGFESLTP
jgi:hypothetical protein